MQAVILAAGMGKRLGELTKNNTKCMIKVNGITLIERVLTQLSSLPLTRIIIVIGYKGEELRAFLGNTYNESDLIFEDSLFRLILDNPYPNLALVDKYETWMDGTMVRLDDENNIVNFIPKKAFKYSDAEQYYKTTNVYKFSKEFLTTHYVPFLEAYTKALGNNEYYEQVLRVITLLDNCDLKALPLTGQKWYEIDDVQDLDIAESLFAPSGKQVSLYQKRFGGYWRFPNLLDFCYLVNPYFPTRRMREEMKANFDILLTEYPSGMNVNSLLIAKYFGIKQRFACVGNGAAELIKSLMEKLSGNIGVVFPTFEEYPNRLDNRTVIPYVPNNKDFTYTVEELQAFFEDKPVSSLLLINPDNPSGNFISIPDVQNLIRWTQRKNIRLIIDESFVDFSTEGKLNSLLSNDILEKNGHLIIIKSISKSYGVPGLRLGVLATSDTRLIDSIRKDVAIWNINSFAEFYMQIFGKYEDDYQRACKKFVVERERFWGLLQQIPYLRVIPSQANYFLCEIISDYSAGELTRLLLERHNILIKDCSAKSAFNGGNYIRIAVRSEKDNNRLIDALSVINNRI